MSGVQHLNLLDESMRPRRERFSSTDGLIALAVLLVCLGLVDGGLNFAATREERNAHSAQQQLIALQSHAPAVAANASTGLSAAELAALQARYAASQQVRGAIQNGSAGSLQGYSPYLVALARQSQNMGARALWITDLSVAADAGGLDLQGRMTDPRVLPDYLNRLNDEPLFRGRAFAQVSLKALPMPADLDAGAATAGDGAPGASVTEFALHANPVGSAGAGAFPAAGGAR
ncbi:MAG: hypothetical protein ABIR54_08700 [Burkholderiaceae bacterium]